jgi:hypothetical protein
MSQTSSKKFYIFATLALLFPVFLVGRAVLAAKSDAETKREYDQIRQEHAEKIELQKQQQKLEQQNLSQPETKNAVS